MEAHGRLLFLSILLLGVTFDAPAFGARAPSRRSVIDAPTVGGQSGVPSNTPPTSPSGATNSSSSSSHNQNQGNASRSLQDEIENIVKASKCKSEKWAGRGLAPEAYILGMAQSFVRSLARVRAQSEVGQKLSERASLNPSCDALAHYETELVQKGMEISYSGVEALKSLYTLGLGLGMRESSGKYCEGFDAAVSQQNSSIAEAGLFQFSYDSRAASSLLMDIYNEYRADYSRCFLKDFSKGVSCKPQAIVGSGAGAAFQDFTKKCPAFAVEYAMLTLRVLRKHYGPINRKEAELKSSCYEMFAKLSVLAARRNVELFKF